jgi:peptidoglycan/LPS O-acetylase OafA/YrhL
MESHRFRPDIEGLRAVAVVAVLAFHAGIPHLAGGFVGVDVFFVISGFLITGLLLDEVRRSGRVSLPDFYARRARRILPAAAVVLVFVAVASRLVMSPLRQMDVAKDVVASAVYLVNWRFINGQTDYMAAGRDSSPLLHFWSLAVEEQFYLVWPLLLLGAAVIARRLRASALPLVLVLAAAGSGLSFFLCDSWTVTREPLAYMGSPARAWEFGIGAALAALVRMRLWRMPALLARVLGWAGIAAVVYAIVSYDAGTPFPGTAALAPVLGVAAVIAAGASITRPRLAVSGVLATAPARWLGRLSFSLYLWHWALLVIVEAEHPSLGWPTRAAIVAASAVPAYLTMRLVEDPVRRSAVVVSRPRSGLSVGVTAMVVPAVIALGVGSQALVAVGATAAAGQMPEVAVGSSAADPFASSKTGGAVTPAVGVARKDTPHYPADCIVSAAETTSPACVLDPVDGPADLTSDRVVLIGDSHAGTWYPAVANVARQHHWSVEVLNKSGCPLPEISVVNSQVGRNFTECDTWRANTLRRLASEPKPRLVFVATLNHYVDDDVYLMAGWTKVLQPLRALGAPVVYLRDTPFPGKDVPACVSGALSHWDRCAFSRSSALRDDPMADGIVDGSVSGVSLVDVNRYLCPAASECPAVRAGVLLYRDDSHPTDTAMAALGPAVEAQLERLRLVTTSSDPSSS